MQNKYPLGHALLKLILLLAAIQAVRALISFGLWNIVHPGKDDLLWSLIDIVAFVGVGTGLLLIFRPTLKDMGLIISPQRRIGYIVAAVIFLLLILLSALFGGSAALLANFHAALLIPIFEELLFRGWGWGKIEEAATGRWQSLVACSAITLLFCLWHIGYADVMALKVLPYNPGMSLSWVLLMKLPVALVIGVLTGLLRWRTGVVYGPILLHGMWNLFGR